MRIAEEEKVEKRRRRRRRERIGIEDGGKRESGET